MMYFAILLVALSSVQLQPSDYAGVLPLLVQRSADWTRDHGYWSERTAVKRGPTTADISSYVEQLERIGVHVSDVSGFRAATGLRRSVRRQDVVRCSPSYDSCSVLENGLHVQVEDIRLPTEDGGPLTFVVGVAVTTQRSGRAPGVCNLLLKIEADRKDGHWKVGEARGFRVC